MTTAFEVAYRVIAIFRRKCFAAEHCSQPPSTCVVGDAPCCPLRLVGLAVFTISLCKINDHFAIDQT